MSTQKAAFASGDRVYNAGGRAALYVTEVSGAHVVQPLIEAGDGDDGPLWEDVDGVALWPEVYREPPRQKLDDEIAKVRAQLIELRSEVGTLSAQKREAQRDMADVLERLKQYEALRYLDQFLHAEITHYVSEVEGQIVVQDAKAFNEATGLSYHERVLSLWAQVRDRSKTLQWKIKADFGERDIWAFPDAEKAHVKAAEIVAARMRDELNILRRGGTSFRCDAVLKNARSLGVEPLPELVEIQRSNQLKSAQAAVENARNTFDKAQATLAALSAPAAPAAA